MGSIMTTPHKSTQPQIPKTMVFVRVEVICKNSTAYFLKATSWILAYIHKSPVPFWDRNILKLSQERFVFFDVFFSHIHCVFTLQIYLFCLNVPFFFLVLKKNICHSNPKYYLCSIKNPQNIAIMSKESLIKLRDSLLGTLSYEDRKWLAGELVDAAEEGFVCPYTKEELQMRIDQAEKEIANGECVSSEVFFRELDQRFNLGWYEQKRIAV